MTTPISYKLHLIAVPLLRGDDVVLCLAGDSMTADCLDSSSNKYINYIFGIIHAWKPPAWSGLCLKAAYTATSETHTAFGSDSSSSCTLTLVAPGATAGCGVVAPSPKQCRQFAWTAGLADGVAFGYCDWSSGERTITFTGNTTGSSDVTLTGLSSNHRAYNGETGYISNHSDAQLNGKTVRIQTIGSNSTQMRVQVAGSPAASDASFTMQFPSQWASGDWFSGVHMAGRIIIHKSTTAGMLGASGTSFSTQPRRNGSGVAGSTAGLVANDTTGLTYIDQAIGNASGYPGIGLLSSGGGDETGKYMLVSGYAMYRHDGSMNRTSGLYVYDVGQTGMTTTGLLGALGGTLGSLATNVPTATVDAWNQANFDADYYIVSIGYNAISSGDYDEVNGGVYSGASGGFADGSYAQFKYNVSLIIDQINANHARRGGNGKPVIILKAQYMAGTDAYASLRAAAMYELSLERTNVGFFNEYKAVGTSMLSPSILNWWTNDGVHMSPDGAGYIAGLMWSAMESEYESYLVGLRTRARRNRGRALVTR